jgi:hypothetical protein
MAARGGCLGGAGCTAVGALICLTNEGGRAPIGRASEQASCCWRSCSASCPLRLHAAAAAPHLLALELHKAAHLPR